MTAKFYVWAGGRWCEVCPATGRVSGAGWKGRASFVFMRRGRLHVARHKHVLRGLRALAAREPSSVRDGAKLQRQRRKGSKHKLCSGCRHTCCPARSVNEESVSNNNRKNVVDAAVQATVCTSQPTDVPPPAPAPAPARGPRPPRTVLKCSRPAILDEYDSSDSVQTHKELIINESDADLFRSYLIKHDPDFDVLRFDSDENFRSRIFFKINPLVTIEKCTRIERMLRASQCSQDTLSLKDFATKLGLRSISDQELVNSKRYKMRRRKKETPDEEDTDKENDVVDNTSRNRNTNNDSKLVNKNLKRKLVDTVRRNIRNDLKATNRQAAAADIQVEASNTQKRVAATTDSDQEFAKKSMKFFNKKVPSVRMLPMKFKKNKVSGAYNGYSNLEDHAIVAWVSGGRSRLVNGNKIWRELQQQFHSLTGIKRTFHSLRNRYLRYILPSLQQLSLPPQQASRLRADAAAGLIKTRNKNSDPYPFSYPRVRSAWSARQKTPSGSAQENSESTIDNNKDIQKYNSPLKTNKDKRAPTKNTSNHVQSSSSSESQPSKRLKEKRRLPLKPEPSNKKPVVQKPDKSPSKSPSRYSKRTQIQIRSPSAPRQRISRRDQTDSSSDSSSNRSDTKHESTDSSYNLFRNKSLREKPMHSKSKRLSSTRNKSLQEKPRSKITHSSATRSLRDKRNLSQSQSLLPQGKQLPKTPRKSRSQSISPIRNTSLRSIRNVSRSPNANKSLSSYTGMKNSTPANKKRVRSSSESPVRTTKKAAVRVVSISSDSSTGNWAALNEKSETLDKTKSKSPARIKRMSRELRMLTQSSPSRRAPPAHQEAPDHQAPRPRTRRLYNHVGGLKF